MTSNHQVATVVLKLIFFAGKKTEQLLKSNIDDTKKKLNIEPENGMNFMSLAKGRLDENELRKSAVVQKAVVKWKCLIHKHNETG